MGWQKIEDQPEYERRPHRQFIIVEGWKAHSGVTWARAAWGIASIRREDDPECMMGYYRVDVERIRRDGDMDGVNCIRFWMPAILVPFPAEVRC